MECPKCSNKKNKKDGFVLQRQRYKCSFCGYRFSVIKKKGTAEKYTKRQALELYLEGYSTRSISKLLGISHVSICSWMKQFPSADLIRREKPIKQINIKKALPYLKKKQNRSGAEMILTVLGKRHSDSFLITRNTGVAEE